MLWLWHNLTRVVNVAFIIYARNDTKTNNFVIFWHEMLCGMVIPFTKQSESLDPEANQNTSAVLLMEEILHQLIGIDR